MPEQPRTDEATTTGSVAPRRVLVAASSEPVAVTYGRLLGTQGFEPVLCPLSKLGIAAAGEVPAGCALVVGTGADEDAAFDQVATMRSSDSQQVRRTAAVLLASSGARQAEAWSVGVDGFVVMPAHLTEVVAVIDDVLARPRVERQGHRDRMIATIGRR